MMEKEGTDIVGNIDGSGKGVSADSHNTSVVNHDATSPCCYASVRPTRNDHKFSTEKELANKHVLRIVMTQR